jgi:hypothetical protein
MYILSTYNLAYTTFSNTNLTDITISTHLGKKYYINYFNILLQYQNLMEARGGVVVKALRYKPAGRGFHSRWCQWNFSVT